MPIGADSDGDVTFELTLSPPRPIAAHGTFSGRIGGIATSADARLADDEIRAWLRSARVPGQVPTLQGAAGLPYDLELQVDASGPIASPLVRVHAASGRSTMDSKARLSFSPGPRISGTVSAKHVDARRFSPDAPNTDLAMNATASYDASSSVGRGTFTAEIDPSTISGVSVPRVSITGGMRGPVVRANVAAEDSRGKARLDLVLRPSDKLDVDATVHVEDLARVTRGAIEGRGDVLADGTIDLSSLRAVANVSVSAEDIAAGGAHIGKADATSTLRGALKDPSGEVSFLLERVGIGERRFRSAAGRLRGTKKRADFEAIFEGEFKAPTITARGELALGPAVTVRDVSVSAQRDGASAVFGAASIRVEPNELRVERAVALGLGEPIHADLVRTPRELRLEARAPRVDVRRLARIFGLDSKRFGGEIGADVDVRASPREANGHVDVQVRKAFYGRGPDANASGEVSAKLEGKRADLLARVNWNGGQVNLESKGFEIDGSVLTPDTWVRARGALDVSARLDLDRLRALIPPNQLPFDELGGTADVRVRLERHEGDAPPSMLISLRTNALRLAQKGATLEPADSVAVQAPAPWHIEGVDFDGELCIDPSADRTDLRLTARDQKGPIAEVTFDSAALPMALAQRPDEIRPFFDRTPSHVVVHVPRRRFADFPPPLERPSAVGSVEFKAEAKGTLKDPDIEATLSVDDVASRPARKAPFDAELTARFAKGELHADGDLSSAKRVVARASVQGHADFSDLLDRRLGRFDVALRASLDRFPIESLSILAAERIRGKLSGDVEGAIGPATSPFLKAKLEANGLSVGRVHDNRVVVSVDAERDTLRASARVDEIDGSADVRATMPITFPFSAPNAVPASSRAMHAELTARNFRLAVLRPVASAAVSGLDGRLDGNVMVAVADGGKNTSMTGGFRLSEGAFEVPSLGEEFGAVAANVTFDRGSNIAINDIHAEGPTGRMDGSASFHLSGYTIDHAEAAVWVPKSDPWPVIVGGQALADAWGNFKATLGRRPDSTPDVRIQVSKAGVRLPNRSAHALQPLEPAERVRIGIMKAPGQLETLRAGPMAVSRPGAGATVRIDAKDVEVRRGTELRVRLDGAPVVKTGLGEGVYGTITLRQGGYLYVQGKKFEIEKGTITFHGDAEDPEVVVTAAWAAPDGSRVYADFVGPVKSGKLTLRSDPPHTKSEILSLVLFGTTTGNVAPSAGGGGSVGSSSATGAATLGGGFAAQGLNRAIDDLTGLDVTTRVDTSDSANPRPEVEVRVARDVSVALAHVLGVPPPGTNPDRNFATIDFRVKRNWSIQTTVGDQGSSLLDLLWQYRY
jgi:translocation and assembly module TamB